MAVLPEGTKVALTGQSSNGYRSISHQGQTRWVSAAYLADGAPAASLPATYQARATAALMIRTSSAASFTNLGDVPAGTILDATGVTENGMAQIVRGGTIRWVNGAYLQKVGAAGPAAPAPAAPPATQSGSGSSVSGSCQASYYDEPQLTASGEQFNPNAMTAAHKTLPLGTRLRVTNPATGASVVVRINDRGPYISGRCLDLSRAAFAAIGNLNAGVMNVTYATA